MCKIHGAIIFTRVQQIKVVDKSDRTTKVTRERMYGERMQVTNHGMKDVAELL